MTVIPMSVLSNTNTPAKLSTLVSKPEGAGQTDLVTARKAVLPGQLPEAAAVSDSWCTDAVASSPVAQ